MRQYCKERRMPILAVCVLFASVNLYLVVLCASSIYFPDLVYLDAMILTILILLAAGDYRKWKRIPSLLDVDVRSDRRQVEHILGKQAADVLGKIEQEYELEKYSLEEKTDIMADYITKWSHEIKLPLSALALMNERNQDWELKKEMQDCLERMQQLLNTMMMGNKLKNMENDIKLEKVSLEACVNKALRNQSYFLIQEHFQIEKEGVDLFVYSDKKWLVYILDQLIGNAVKYRDQEPVLLFKAKRIAAGETLLSIEDHGIGIEPGELPFLFERGYIGSNLRNGDYRSTGMGLYFVKETAKRLGIKIRVCSKPGEWTRFDLYFLDNAAYVTLQNC